MKATIVNTYDILGGAALAGYALFRALNRFTDVETRILCKIKHANDEGIRPILPPRYRKIDSIFNSMFMEPTLGQNYWLPFGHKILSHPFIKDTDIINLHNIHGDYLPYPVIRRLSRIAPLIVSMQDMWYLTGHCSYAYDCPKYLDGCRACPDLLIYPVLKHDTAWYHWKKKKRIFADSNIAFVTCSHWLKGIAEASPLLGGRSVNVIHNPVETESLKPRDPLLVRRVLEIPTDRKVIAFGAARIDNERKGFPALLKRMNEKFVKEHRLFLLLMGRDPLNFVNSIPPWLPFKFMGNIPSAEFRSLVYNAADAFVFPTTADNLSNMLIESLSCGTPCVTFDVGGCGEVVVTNETGYLAPAGDWGDFFEGLAVILQERSLREKMAVAARKMIVESFTPEICAEKYRNLFAEIVASSSAGVG